MTFIETIPEDQAAGLVQDLYQAAQKNMGYVPNYVKVLSLRPEKHIWNLNPTCFGCLR